MADTLQFKIWEEGVSTKKKEFSFRLIAEDRGVAVCAVDSTGRCFPRGKLVIFLKDGTLERCRNIDPEFGFQLDEVGRIKISS